MGLLTHNTPWNARTIITMRLSRFSQKTSNARIVPIIAVKVTVGSKRSNLFRKKGLCNNVFVGAFSFAFLKSKRSYTVFFRKSVHITLINYM